MTAPILASTPELAIKPLVTAEDLLALSSKGRFELINGEVIEMSPPGYEHGAISNLLAYVITRHVVTHKLGQVFAAETGFRLARNPDTVRAADVAFIAKERLPSKPPKGYSDITPDLVAEVVSPGDDPDDVQAKVKVWLDASVKVVLVVYPGPQQIAVYHSLRAVIVLTADDMLELADVLPGFTCPVSEIFT